MNISKLLSFKPSSDWLITSPDIPSISINQDYRIRVYDFDLSDVSFLLRPIYGSNWRYARGGFRIDRISLYINFDVNWRGYDFNETD